MGNHENMARAAKYKALIVALLNRTGTLLSHSEISAKLEDELTADSYKAHNLRGLLAQLAANKMIICDVAGNRKLYHSTQYPAPADADEPVVERKSKKDAAPTLKVDLVKDTGRVRITLQGLVIEIGVVDK